MTHIHISHDYVSGMHIDQICVSHTPVFCQAQFQLAVQCISAELRLALILVITTIHHHPLTHGKVVIQLIVAV